MAGQKVATLFTKKDIHNIWSGLWYGILTQKSAEDLVTELLSTMEEQSDILVDIKATNPISFKEICDNKEKYVWFVVSELKEAFDEEYKKAAEIEQGYI